MDKNQLEVLVFILIASAGPGLLFMHKSTLNNLM